MSKNPQRPSSEQQTQRLPEAETQQIHHLDLDELMSEEGGSEVFKKVIRPTAEEIRTLLQEEPEAIAEEPAAEAPAAQRDETVEVKTGEATTEDKAVVAELVSSPERKQEYARLLKDFTHLRAKKAQGQVYYTKLEQMGRKVFSHPKYQLEEAIGEGGMGDVKKVLDLDLQRHVAMKTVKSSNIGNMRRFLLEMKKMGQIGFQNNHLQAVYDAGIIHDEEGEKVYYTMPIATGSLDDQLEQWEKLSPQEMLDRMPALIELAQAVQVAHDHGIIHRDIKPKNILIGEDGKLILTDFGLLKLLHEDMGEALRKTEERHIIGTPSYMAPEQIINAEQGEATDWYTFAHLLFSLFTGEMVFKGEMRALVTQLAVYAKPGKGGDLSYQKEVKEGVQERLKKAGVPEHLASWIIQMLEPKPADRIAPEKAVQELAKAYMADEAAEKSWTKRLKRLSQNWNPQVMASKILNLMSRAPKTAEEDQEENSYPEVIPAGPTEETVLQGVLKEEEKPTKKRKNVA